MDIGLERWTVSTGIPRIKIYPLICCNTFIIIKCCYGNMNRQTSIHKHVHQKVNPPLKSFLENEMRKLGANQKLQSGIFCVLESGIFRGRIWNPAPRIHNLQRRIKNTVQDYFTWGEICLLTFQSLLWQLKSPSTLLNESFALLCHLQGIIV